MRRWQKHHTERKPAYKRGRTAVARFTRQVLKRRT